MTRWTQEQYDDYQNRLRLLGPKLPACYPNLDADPGPESKLQAKCEKWLKDHGFPFLSFRQSGKVKTVLPAGWPDLICVLRGKVRFIELKAAKGRLSDEQKATRIAFLHLGHYIHECRSFKKFLEIVNE